MCLLPKFDENDVESFFVTFEKYAESLSWPAEHWVLMLQSAFVGKAQKICTQMPAGFSYAQMKETLLTAYELVPEAYRQKFRAWKRKPGQTFIEFSREKEQWFDRWYRSLKQEKKFEMLRETILLEEFKNNIPAEIRTHLDEQSVTELHAAAMMADSYELTHRKSGSGVQPNKWSDRYSAKPQVKIRKSKSGKK